MELGAQIKMLGKVRKKAKHPYRVALFAAALSVLTGIILLVLHYIFT